MSNWIFSGIPTIDNIPETNWNIRVSNRQYTWQTALKYIEIKFLLFLHVFRFILNEFKIKLSVLKNRLSVGHPNISVSLRYIVLGYGYGYGGGIPTPEPIPIPEEIQLLMYAIHYVYIFKTEFIIIFLSLN